MLEKLRQVEARYTEVEAKLDESAYYADPAVSRALFQEQSRLRPIIETYRAYLQTQTDLAETRALLDDPDLLAQALGLFFGLLLLRGVLAQFRGLRLQLALQRLQVPLRVLQRLVVLLLALQDDLLFDFLLHVLTS